MTESYSS